MRMVELFMGKRMAETTAERTLIRGRILATYSALFGIPVATGVGAFPFNDYMRKWAMDNGYNVGENFWTTMAMEGIPSLIGGLITGHGDVQKGTYTNFSTRMGAPGLDIMREALKGDKPWFDLIGGAAFNKLGGILTAGSDFFRVMLSQIRQDDQIIPIKKDIFLNVLKEFSATLTAGERAYVAANTGQWLSKGGAVLDTDVSATAAITMGILGLAPIKSQDAFIKQWSIKDREEAMKKSQKQFEDSYHKALTAMKNQDYEQAKDYFQGAFARLRIAGYPSERISQAIQQANTGSWQSLSDRIDFSYFTKDLPDSEKVAKQQQFERSLKMQMNKGQQ
jgi:hypothetical protein